MSETGKAVFLSYAREDTDAVRRIAEALRAGGVNVWFDQSELVGGDAWDAKIRGQVGACALFVPVISAATQARLEGYFRLEWKLAANRTHTMAEEKTFLLPVVIDATHDAVAKVPAEFRAVQWTRIDSADSLPAFCERVQKLLRGPDAVGGASRPDILAESRHNTAPTARLPSRPRLVPTIIGLAAAIGLALWRPWTTAPAPTKAAPSASSPAAQPPTDLAPTAGLAKVDAKSVAVLPFANLSTEKDNEFFADGVHDDVITNLQKIRDLKVISRTSVLAFRDAAARNLAKIAADLGVANVVEGSVRRVGKQVRVNAKLIVARTEVSLWADTLTGDASDIFALQATIAEKIATALKATLTLGERTLIARRPTENQEAYDLYSRARLMEDAIGPTAGRESYESIIALHEQAVAKDPGFALAFAALSVVHGKMYWFGAIDPTSERRARAQAALVTARRLAPDGPETHAAIGAFAYLCDHDWRSALAEYALAEPSLPNDAKLQYLIGIAHRRLVQWPEAERAFERAVVLNPYELSAATTLVETMKALRRFEEARSLAARYLTIFPADQVLRDYHSRAQFALDGDVAARARILTALGPTSDDPSGLKERLLAALLSGDFAGAERVAADPEATTLKSFNSAIVEPVARSRALVAYVRGQREAAVKFADETIAFYRGRTWTRRQQPLVSLAIAEVDAFAGRTAAAVRDGRIALEQYRAFDAYMASMCELILARIYVVAGQPEEALKSLRQAMASANDSSPAEVRHDPILSRLKGDPRFEEILKAAKAL